MQGFKDRAKAEQERFAEATDTSFYCTLVFQTEAQKLQFLEAMQWLQFGNLFIDGLQIAKHEKVPLVPVDLRNKKIKKPDPKLAALAMD